MRLIDADVLLKNLEWLEDYDHYVLHDVKITMEETPTVKAIPIEWIKEHYAYYGLIKQLIEEWEKENEKDI